MSSRVLLFFILLADGFILLLQVGKLSISYEEARLFFDGSGFVKEIAGFFASTFAQNDYAIRVPMIVLHIFSAILLYKNSKNYLVEQKHRMYLVIFFILTPGVISSAILLNSAGFVIFALLLFLYVHQNFHKTYSLALLAIYAFLEPSFAILFLGTSIFAIVSKDRVLLGLSAIMFFVSLYIYGINMHGAPRGYFLDSLGLYGAIFTPILFIYLIYTLYRVYLTKELDLIWYLATTAFLLSLVLSFRQRVYIDLFAPYMILAYLPMAKLFEHSYRVRLKNFRRGYKAIFSISIVLLVLNSFVVIFNEHLYMFIKEPKKHFAHKMHIAKPLANELLKNGINCINSDEKMTQRLQFYGVAKCNEYKLVENPKTIQDGLSVTISYKKRVIYRANVTKLNSF